MAKHRSLVATHLIQTNSMRDHLKILGWLYAGSGALILLLGVLLGTILGAAAAATFELALGVVAIVAATFIGVIALPSLICGWGLLNYKPWARVLGIILSTLQLANFPIGTALGGYGLWVLLNDDTKRML